jgi:hypothetical protein
LSRIKTSLDHKRIRRLIWLVLTVFVLLGYSLQCVAGSAYYSMVMQAYGTVSSPPVILEEGNVTGASTIYANKTSAKVNVTAPLFDYVDNNDSNVDSSSDKGTHSNFTAQQYGPDSINDTLTEGNTELTEYVWISGNDDFVRKLNKSDLGGTEILSWDTGTSYPFGCEYRIEDGNECIYIVDYRQNPDALIKFHANNGTEVTRWDISGYSDNAYGLAWNGSRWFIADWVDGLIYQVGPADPTVQERNFSYTGIVNCEGLAWDGSYLWTVDSGTDKVYQIDIYGNIQTSWDFTPTDPTGIAYDTNSGHLWIVGRFPEYLYEYYTNGTEINNWDPSGAMPTGVAYASVEETYNCELDLEVQWTNAEYAKANEELCIKTGTTDAEDIKVDVWNGSEWINLLTDLNASSWNNVSVSSYLTSSNFTIRFKGGNETGDTTQDSWNIDATLLHVWTTETYDHVLKVVNQVADNWTVNLQVYDSFNIDRLSSLNISLHDGASSNQIAVSGGNITKSEGEPYNLPGGVNSTIYISMSNLQAITTGTSYLYVHLKIQVPNTSTYSLYVITFEIN